MSPAQMKEAYPEKIQKYAPIQLALQHYIHTGWSIEILPWVAGILGFADTKQHAFALAVREVGLLYELLWGRTPCHPQTESSRGGLSEPNPLGSSVWCRGWAAGGGPAEERAWTRGRGVRLPGIEEARTRSEYVTTVLNQSVRYKGI